MLAPGWGCDFEIHHLREGLSSTSSTTKSKSNVGHQTWDPISHCEEMDVLSENVPSDPPGLWPSQMIITFAPLNYSRCQSLNPNPDNLGKLFNRNTNKDGETKRQSDSRAQSKDLMPSVTQRDALG